MVFLFTWFYVSLALTGLTLFLCRLHRDDEWHRTGKTFGETYPWFCGGVVVNLLLAGGTMGVLLIIISGGG